MSACDSLPTVRVISKGYLVRKGQEVEKSSSTVTLVESGSHRIVVDTGDYSEKDALAKEFAAISVPLDSIQTVINTHLHRDHSGGNDLFTGAKFVAHELEDPPMGTLRISRPTSILHGITIVPTPGHTHGSVSVFVEGRRRYAMTGDALPTKSNYDNHVPPSMNIDRALAIGSMDAILEWAEVVVPGHDALFEVIRKR